MNPQWDNASAREVPIAALIPHSGAMCLLDRVIDWTDTTARCTARSHRDALNPLRHAGRLPAATIIEYAAQAMAVHGGLVAAGRSPRAGMLASARNVELGVDRLDELADDLLIEVRMLTQERNALLYVFEAHAGGQRIATGRIVVALQ